MKFRATLCDKHGFARDISAATRKVLEGISEITDEQRDAIQYPRELVVRDLCKKWIDANGCLTVEIDTIADTIQVINQGDAE